MKHLILFVGVMCSTISIAQEIEIELFATGVSNPVNIKHAGDSRLFVVDRDGLIQIINEKGSVNDAPFLNIMNQVSDAKDERGLLGLAFHPNYSSNGYFYVNYVNKDSKTVISRFTRSGSNSQLADQKSELVLITMEQPYANHNGGELAFDRNGYLFIALGDGGNGGDPENRSQNLETFFGKLLRIDVDHPQNTKNYSIPKDNPFVGHPTARPEIWASGLRNPWKFSIDMTTNDMWIADVGQENYEEINKVSASDGGLNFGWRCYESNHEYNMRGCPDIKTLTFPIAEYSHNNSGLFKCSITGGYRYRGKAQSSLYGIYFFADYCSSEIGMLKPSDDAWEMSFSKEFKGNNWTTFGEDIHGELYIADMSSGSIYKIKDTALGIGGINLSEAKLYPNPVNDEVTIDLGTLDDQFNIILYTMQGQKISIASTSKNNVHKISTRHLAKGLYLMEILNKSGQKTTRKFVKN